MLAWRSTDANLHVQEVGGELAGKRVVAVSAGKSAGFLGICMLGLLAKELLLWSSKSALCMKSKPVVFCCADLHMQEFGPC